MQWRDDTSLNAGYGSHLLRQAYEVARYAAELLTAEDL
jgi:hypothetical protein